MSKVHSTNYYNTFIEIAEDSKVNQGAIPPVKNDKQTVASLQFEMVYNNPYKYSSDEVLFDVFALRKALGKDEIAEQKSFYFSKGQPCFRASPLTKSYGWGVHSNADGKIAIFDSASPEYAAFLSDDSVKKVKAMKSKR